MRENSTQIETPANTGTHDDDPRPGSEVRSSDNPIGPEGSGNRFPTMARRWTRVQSVGRNPREPGEEPSPIRPRGAPRIRASVDPPQARVGPTPST